MGRAAGRSSTDHPSPEPTWAVVPVSSRARLPTESSEVEVIKCIPYLRASELKPVSGGAPHLRAEGHITCVDQLGTSGSLTQSPSRPPESAWEPHQSLPKHRTRTGPGDKRTQQDGQGGHHWLPMFLIHPGFRFSPPIHPTSRAGEAGGGATLMDFCHVSNWGCHLSKSSNYTNCTIPFASAAVTPWGLGVQEAVSSPQGFPSADKES